jgi:hypothetical protein
MRDVYLGAGDMECLPKTKVLSSMHGATKKKKKKRFVPMACSCSWDMRVDWEQKGNKTPAPHKY